MQSNWSRRASFLGKPARVTAILTRRSPAEVLEAFEKTCGGLTWKVFEDSHESFEGGTITSHVARSSIHFQSIQLEILDDFDMPSTIMLIHPRFLHAVKLPVLPFIRLPLLADSVIKRIERFVRQMKKLDPDIQLRYRTLWKGFLTTGGPPDTGEIGELVATFDRT